MGGWKKSKEEIRKTIRVKFRLEFSLTSCRLQHVMIFSEKECIKTKGRGRDQLRDIKESCLVIAPDEIISRVSFKVL